jgi:heme/copper-type cytochrome/quinol oxidase subunit 2
MWGAIADRIWGIFFTAAAGSYLIVGAVVVLYISTSSSWTKNWRPDASRCDEHENKLRTVSMWTWIFLRFPITFVLHVAVWPLYFSWYLDHRDEKNAVAEAEERNTSPHDGP